jgi:hypothetical protein
MVDDAQGLVHYEFIPEGHTLKKEITSESSVTSGMRREGNSWKYGDKTACFSFMTVQLHIGHWWSKKYLAKHNVMALEHLPSSVNLSPPDFSCFHDKKSSERTKFMNTEEAIAKVMRTLTEV